MKVARSTMYRRMDLLPSLFAFVCILVNASAQDVNATESDPPTTMGPSVVDRGTSATTTMDPSVEDVETGPIDPTGRDGYDDDRKCYTDLNLIHEVVGSYEPFDQKRIVLCPNTTFEVGFQENFVWSPEVQRNIQPRQYTEYLCGEDGNSANNCIIQGGEYHVQKLYIDWNMEPLVRSSFKGITFEGANNYNVFIVDVGDIVFEDCVWRDSRSGIQVLLAGNTLETARKLTVDFGNGDELKSSLRDDKQHRSLQGPQRLRSTFNNCRFENNAISDFETSRFGIMEVYESDLTDLILKDCLFFGNKFNDPDLSVKGFAIRIESGNTFNMTGTCFENNDFLGNGTILVDDMSIITEVKDNFASDDQGEVQCNFIYDGSTGNCANADLTACGGDFPVINVVPTASPTQEKSAGKAFTITAVTWSMLSMMWLVESVFSFWN